MSRCTAINPITNDQCDLDEGHQGIHQRTAAAVVGLPGAQAEQRWSDALAPYMSERGLL